MVRNLVDFIEWKKECGKERNLESDILVIHCDDYIILYLNVNAVVGSGDGKEFSWLIEWKKEWEERKLERWFYWMKERKYYEWYTSYSLW
jgi:hypothetical protein